MMILVSVDIEGIAGVVHPEQTRFGHPESERARRWMTGEANAAIRGAFAGGASRVVVNDSHGQFRNLLPDELDPRAEVLLGKPRDLGMVAGVDDPDCKAVLLVGWDARSAAPGILSHTISSFAFARVLVNGVDAGEASLYGGVAAEFGVPVALFTGDDAFVAETAPLFPGAIGVVVKRAHGHRVATSLSPGAACDAIEAGAREAAAKCASLELQPLPTPLNVRVEATSVALADLFAMLPILRRADALALEFRAPTMRYAVRVLNSLSAMSFMLR
jgi:D-amino peptidase